MIAETADVRRLIRRRHAVMSRRSGTEIPPGRVPVNNRAAEVTFLWQWHEIGMTPQEVRSNLPDGGSWGIWGVQRRRDGVA